jgi:ubiquinone/menaquinone biosynthesis C-methylase UbiE
LRPGEGQNREIDRDALRAVEKALRATGELRSILDVGCGNGRWLSTLRKKKKATVVALDLSRDALGHCRSAAGDDVALACGDAGALPFPPQSFDLVVCLGLMPYVRRTGRLRALREMRRVSARWVVVEYAHVEGASFFFQRLRQRVGLEAKLPRNHLTSSEVEDELRRAGLGIRGFAPVGGAFSKAWVVLAEAPSPDWMRS